MRLLLCTESQSFVIVATVHTSNKGNVKSLHARVQVLVRSSHPCTRPPRSTRHTRCTPTTTWHAHGTVASGACTYQQPHMHHTLAPRVHTRHSPHKWHCPWSVHRGDAQRAGRLRHVYRAAHHTTCTTIRHIMGIGRSSAATSHVRPNRLSAGIPAGPLARAATSASNARDCRQESQISSTPTLADFSSHLVCLDCSTFSLHRRRTESRRRWGKSGFGHAARALRDAPRRHALPSLLARARGRARFVTARPPAATRGTTASTASRRQPLSTSVTTSRFHKKTHSVGG